MQVVMMFGFCRLQLTNKDFFKKMEDFTRLTSTHLIALWIDLNRPKTQWSTEGRPGQWEPCENYQRLIAEIESTLCKKLQLSVLEIRTILAYKKACQDQQEMLLFQKKKEDNKNTQKIKKHLDNVARGMGEINSVVMEAHDSICKLGCYSNVE